MKMSRGEEQELGQIGDEKSCPVTNSAISVKESVLGEKARAVEENWEILIKTEDLVDSVVALKNNVVTGTATSDLILARYAEACVVCC